MSTAARADCSAIRVAEKRYDFNFSRAAGHRTKRAAFAAKNQALLARTQEDRARTSRARKSTSRAPKRPRRAPQALLGRSHHQNPTGIREQVVHAPTLTIM
jgi:hypothetical protein